MGTALYSLLAANLKFCHYGQGRGEGIGYLLTV